MFCLFKVHAGFIRSGKGGGGGGDDQDDLKSVSREH